MRMEHSTFLELLHMFLYQRLNSNWHMLCNLSTPIANELRNSRVAQKISEQLWLYATDCANCQSAPCTVNQLHNKQCCATWLIVKWPLYIGLVITTLQHVSVFLEVSYWLQQTSTNSETVN
jgi:hypothetical protein